MSLTKCAVFVVVLTFLSYCRGDPEVCVMMNSCILPCSFQAGDDAVIHWIAVINDSPVHSYYHKQDQLARQNPRYKDRTSLFKDQISRGDASLLLKRAEAQDAGRYKCYTSTITGSKESYIDLVVEAPVRIVNIQMVEDIITCSSEGIYPEPKLTWSTNPPSNVTRQDEVKTEQQIYNIKSSLIRSENVLDYTCTVSNGRRKKTARWYRPTPMNGLNTETTINCTATDPPRTRLIWTFNQSEVILNQTGNEPYTASKKWEKLVKSVSESGALILQHLSSDHEGTYTCEQSNDEETLITNTVLRKYSSGNAGQAAGIVIGVTLGILIILAVLIYIYRKSISKKLRRKGPYQNTKQEDHPELNLR